MHFLIFIAIYAYFAYSLQVIAEKTKTKDTWLAWIPIANLYLMANIAKKPGWWLILLLIPVVGTIFMAIIWWEIAKTRNKPGWVGLLIVIPFVGLIPTGLLAFTD